MKRYNPKEIEPKWQEKWAQDKIYEPGNGSGKPKKYVLEYFPYPSGAAMHVGHVRNYTIGDALSRFARMRGYDVLHPMGWDAFGLPAENYAIKTGISPKEAIAQNTRRFKQQLTQMGFGYDWSREFASSDPEYYKWTQWFFLLLYKRGLAYRKESLQWWCPFDKTVLANEQVENGMCWRCGNQVEKKALKQWFFKITDYADRLVSDLEDLNWTDSIKNMQRNWIGRSKGAEVRFKIDQPQESQAKDGQESITVFTTRPDTLLGATFIVLAPEHELVAAITAPGQQTAVKEYMKAVQAKSDIERQETNREKTGVFTGTYAINPVNNERIPIWIADYVLAGYGTGAIMAVPAHDERDFAFAQRFDLPIKTVIEPETGTPQENPEFRRSIVAVVRNPKNNTYLSINWGKLGGNLFIGGGRDDGEDLEGCARREIAEETGYTNLKLVTKTGKIHHNYFAHSKNVARRIEVYGLLFDLVDDTRQAIQLEKDEQGKFSTEWLNGNVVEQRVTESLHALCFQLLVKSPSYHGEGYMVNSGAYDGQPSASVRDAIVAELEKQGDGKERTNYKIRDWLISRQRYWGAPIPMIHCKECGEVPELESKLPVVLPDLTNFEPSGDGRSPLANVPEFIHVSCPRCGGTAERETDTMDGFACSSWYFLRFADPHNSQAVFDPALVKQWLPVDDYIGGAEHAVMHLLYARMWTKVMQDAGLIDFGEPFKTLRNQGMILAPDGQKMSKSKGNTIEPDGLIEQGYGADAIRIMELFIGPWNQSANWSVEGMGGSFRFLQRVWTLVQELDAVQAGNSTEKSVTGATSNTELKQVLHAAIYKVSKDLEDLGFNTAIASLMEALNSLYKLKLSIPMATQYADWKEILETFLQLLAPFAPHIAEELWQQLGNESSIHMSEWPSFDQKYLTRATMTIVVQINGKVRAQLELPAEAEEADVLQAAQVDTRIATQLAGKPLKKSIYVPKKLINFVI